ncbi:MAG: RNA-binding protein, partial [Rhodospirillaceae bacterium]|nr:RNA-binding protein [Rhodospirillaceae bacterium]
ETLAKTALVRFVIGPDGCVVPDIDGRLPGRGLWLAAQRDIVGDASSGGSFAKAARRKVEVPEGLVDRVEKLLTRRCLDLLSLARRAGDAVAGFEKLSAALKGGGWKKGRPALVLIAADSGKDGRRRIEGIIGDVPMVSLFTGAELGAVFGRDRSVHVGVAPGGFAERLIVEAGRLAGFRFEGPVDETEIVDETGAVTK